MVPLSLKSGLQVFRTQLLAVFGRFHDGAEAYEEAFRLNPDLRSVDLHRANHAYMRDSAAFARAGANDPPWREWTTPTPAAPTRPARPSRWGSS